MGASTIYLDIETDKDQEIYIIGILSRSTGLVQLTNRDVNRRRLLRELPPDGTIVTFNGASFDLPRIRRALGVDLEGYFGHLDLMHRCHRYGHFGGQKMIEKMLKFPRPEASISHWQQWRLRDRWVASGCQVSRDRLLRYNEHDLRGMRWIKNRV